MRLIEYPQVATLPSELVINRRHPLARSLFAWFPLACDGRDYARNNHGTIKNVAWGSGNWMSAPRGSRGLCFDGVNDYVDFGTADGGVGWATNALTISCWVFPQTSSQDSAIVGWMEGSIHWPDKYGLGLQYISGSVYALAAQSGSLPRLSSPMSAGQWHHIVAVFTTSGLLRIDGVQVASGDLSSGWGYIFGIGCARGWSGYSTVLKCFNGYIADVRLYRRQLSNVELQMLYESPFAMCEGWHSRAYSIPATGGLFRRIGMDGGMMDLTAGIRG